MKKLSIFTLSSMALAFTPAVNAVDIGFGASLKSDNTAIYMPINVSGWIIEPSLQFSKRESSNRVPTTNNYSSSNYSTPEPSTSSSTGTGTNSDEFESESFSIGLGLFKENTFEKGFSAYYGARVGYMESEYNSTYTNTSSGTGVSTNNNGATSTRTESYLSTQISNSKDDGYFIMPTLGIKYALKGNFSISLESSITYFDLSGESTTSNAYSNNSTETPATIYNTNSSNNTGTGNGKSNSSFSGTQQTDIVFRYMF